MIRRTQARPRPRTAGAAGRFLCCAGIGVALAIGGAVAPGVAHANGAFPTPFRVLVPDNQPNEIILTTTFGVISSSDGGNRWTWVCEHGAGNLGYFYQLAPPPGSRMFAVATAGLVRTDDVACTWSAATGLGPDATLADAFTDQVDGGRRVMMLGRPGQSGAPSSSLFVSMDGGLTINPQPLYMAPAGMRFDSVETAATLPMRVYLTQSPEALDGRGPWLLRSDDGGHNFEVIDVSPTTGAGVLKIAAVDPADADKLYLRFSGTGADNFREHLVVATGGGRTLTKAITLEGAAQFSAFLRRRDGTMLAAGNTGLAGVLYRSTDSGQSFHQVPGDLQIRSLAERGTTVFAVSDSSTDPFVVGTSTNNGDSFTPLFVFDDVLGVRACPGADLRPDCAQTCATLVNYNVFRPEICNVLVAETAPPDGGGGGTGGTGGGADAGRDAGGSEDAGPPKSSPACGCATTTPPMRVAGPLVLLAVVVLLMRRRRPRPPWGSLR